MTLIGQISEEIWFMKFGHQIILANSNLQSAMPELLAGKHLYLRPSFAIRVLITQFVFFPENF